MNILIVDDSATIRDRLGEMLSILPGVGRVDTTANVSEARQYLQSAPPDVVVLDVHLPGGDGIEVLDALRPARDGVTVIVLTNDPTPQSRDTYRRAGADFFFDKSSEFQRSVDIIAGLALARRALRDQLLPCWTCFDRLPIPTWVIDVDTLAFKAVNEAAVLLYGYSREEFLTMSVADIQRPEDVPVLMEQIGQRRAGAPSRSAGTRQHRAKDGSSIHVEITATPFDRPGERLDLVMAHDISERRRFEREVRQAQKMEAVGRLAGGVAHDFNNLLTVIVGFSSDIMERLPPDDPTRADVVQILNAGGYAADLTRQLLAFSRTQILAPRVLDLNAVIGDLTAMLRRLIGADVELAIRTVEDRYAVKADAGQLEQVIVNLVVNARDAMPHGGTLTIGTEDAVLDERAAAERPGLVHGHYVLLTISDTGSGMDALTKAQMFEPFFTTKEAGEGTGLGLSMVYGIVKQSGGYIFADSEPGQGTTFRLYFPRRPADEIESAPKVPAPRRVEGGAESILLVDDDRGVRDFAARVLAARGYAVLSASSAAEALQLCDAHPGGIDLLLTDVVMRGTTGPALAGALRARYPSIRVVYMSGYATDAIDPAVLDPLVTFMAKPFTPQDLRSRIREALDRS